MRNKALGTRYSCVVLSILLALSGCKEIEEALNPSEDVSGTYTLFFVTQDSRSQCTVGSAGCKVEGFLGVKEDEAIVYSGSLFLQGDAPRFQFNAVGKVAGGLSQPYDYDGAYIKSGSNVTFSAGALVFIGVYNKDNMTITVPAKLFNPNATSSSKVVMVFKK